LSVARLSPLPAERAVLIYILAATGWLVSIAVVVPTVYAGEDPGGDVGGDVGGDGIRAFMWLIALALPVVVLRHRDDLPRVYGLRSRFVLAAIATGLILSVIAGAW